MSDTGLTAAWLLSELPDAVVVADLDGTIRYANPAVTTLLGWAPEDLVGRDVLTLVPESLRAAHVNGISRFRSTRVPVLVGHSTRVPALHRDGHEVEVELTLRAPEDPDPATGEVVVATLRDLTELATIVRRHEQLLASVADGVYGLDLDGRVTFVNPAAAKLIGAPEDEQLGRAQHELVHHSHADGSPYPLADCPIHRTLRDATTREVVDEVFWRADGSSFPVEYLVAPVRSGSSPAGVVVTFRDVTARRQAERVATRAARLAAAEAEQRRVIEELQRAIMPARPELPGWRVGVHFAPAGRRSPSGGDLYDWVVLPDGDVHLAVVDAAGHGVRATKHAVALAHAIRALAVEGWPLDRIPTQAGAMLEQLDPEMMASAVVVRLTPSTGEVRLAAAGHPPPLHLYDGGATQLLTTREPPLGAPDPDRARHVDTARLAPGEALLVYTDGLVDADRDTAAGIAALQRLAPELTGSVHERVAVLADTLTSAGDHHDDVLVLLLEREA